MIYTLKFLRSFSNGPVKFFTPIFACLLLCIACSDKQVETDVEIVAHRGGMAERPENTMTAFRRSSELGVKILELDLRTSRDGRIFILHDDMLDRTTDGTGMAADLTMEELHRLDAGSWFDPVYSTERIPSFREVLNWARQEETILLLDLKESGREFAEKVAADVKQYGMEESIVVGVRSHEQARLFRELLPGSSQLGFVGSPDEIKAFANAGVDVIRLWLHWLEGNPSLADEIINERKKLMINGTDGNPGEAEQIMEFSPQWILIDDPASLMFSLQAIN